jgi:hypothetical protein
MRLGARIFLVALAMGGMAAVGAPVMAAGQAAATASAMTGPQSHTVEVPWRGDARELRIVRNAEAEKPFTVAGPQGAVLGQQDGKFEAWVWPVKLLSNLRITAELENYPVPIDMNQQAASVDVEPERTVITYSHAAITVRQIMFAPRETAAGTGAVVLFEVDAVRPGKLRFEFTPEVRRMWPAANYGVPSAEWVKGEGADGAGGFYVLHTDAPEIAAAVTIPGALPGVLAPYQEKPKVYPVGLEVKFDPARDRGMEFPLLMVVANGSVVRSDGGASVQAGAGVVEAHPLNGANAATSAALGVALAKLNDAIPTLYKDTAEYWKEFLATHLRVATPDKQFDDAMAWAEVAIEQSQVEWHAGQRDAEVGMTAGFFSSGDSARPGFGWFFGRDTLWTMFAIDSYGDFALSRKAFDFLLARQRADGKVMHEFSQTADVVDWKSMPYEFAAADATPLLIMAMADYVRASGDTAYLKAHWAQVEKAWEFESSHDADGDGIYDNSQGTGWVESWPQGAPKQEIYLAALDEQASGAMAWMAGIEGDAKLAADAAARGKKIAGLVEQEYLPAGNNFYAFSRNVYAGGTVTIDTTRTIYPTVAWWDGSYKLAQPDAMFSEWASAKFSTDWGTRDVGEDQDVYDPISYHQGSVWPLFTGWASMAEYRTGRPLAGYQHLMANADLTWAQDLGAVTELLSGAFYQPLGRSTSHQMWSSAMVISPAVRGMFGLRLDAETKTLWVSPELPAAWDSAALFHIHAGDEVLGVGMARQNGKLVVTLRPEMRATTEWTLKTESAGAKKVSATQVEIALPGAELGMKDAAPQWGDRTRGVKVVGEKHGPRMESVTLQAEAGSLVPVEIRINGMQGNGKAKVLVNGVAVGGEKDVVEWEVRMPGTGLESGGSAGQGKRYVEKTVTVTW